MGAFHHHTCGPDIMWIYVAALLLAVIAAWKFLGSGSSSSAPRGITPLKIENAPPKIILASKKAKKVKQPGQIGLKVYFGSQTGTAEDFAQTIAEEAATFNFFSEVVDLESVSPEDLEEDEFAIFCLATYGEGEPTDNAKDFCDAIMDEGCPQLPSLKYAVFGLGNNTYEFYNAVARRVDGRLEELGAKKVVPRGEGDDDCSLQEDFANWRQTIWEPICDEFGLEFKTAAKEIKATWEIEDNSTDSNASSAVTWGNKGNSKVIDVKNPVKCKIHLRRELHKPASDRSCVHLEIELQQGMRYEAGDHIGIYPENSKEDVDQWLQYFDLNDTQMMSLYASDDRSQPLVGPCSYRRLLTNFVDLYTPPKKKLIEALAALYTSDENEKERLTVLGAADEAGWKAYNEYIKNPQRTLMEVLADFPSCKPSLAHILELTPPTKPRYYSISSSPKAHPQHAHVTAVVLEYKTGTGRVHRGVCTNWLAGKDVESEEDRYLPCFLRSSTFRLPKDSSLPVIMIGPGTGIAPFRGFLQERHYAENRGTSMLFFGCRGKDIDFLYDEELKEHLEKGTLSELVTAFSRETDKKVYVQHRILDKQEELWPILQTAYLYVCGDKSMAKDVQKAIKQVVIDAGQKSAEEADLFIQNLQSKGRYQQDVW